MCHQLLKAIVALFFISMVACDTCIYSKFTPDHTGCKSRNLSCNIVNNQVTNEDKNLIVKLHNQYREKLAMGREKPGDNFPQRLLLPSATNMREMVWDDELANLAQRHAETCQSDYDCNDCRKVDRFGVGQSIYVSNSSDFPSEWKKMMKSWRHTSYQHYSQVIWADTWRVGCGKVVFEDGRQNKTLVICNYGPGGNLKERPFNPGSTCSECPSGTCCGDSCSVGVRSNYEGLCRLNTCKYKKFTPDHVGCKPRNLSCNIADNQVSNDEKNLILRLHNEFREKVAFGRTVYDLPMLSASNMMELEWDDELASLAQRHAETCDTHYDCDDCRKVDRFNVGQYIYTSISSDFPGEWVKMMLSYRLFEEHFVQLIWADTWTVGCGKAVFEDDSKIKTLIICNYGPGANLHWQSESGNPPYRHGVTGSECGMNTCIGDYCDGTGIRANYEGLCKRVPPPTPVSNTGNFKLVKCRLSRTGGSPTNESTPASTTGNIKFVICRLPSTGELPTLESITETTPASTTGGFKFLMCHLRTAGDIKFVKCRLSSTGGSPAPESTPASTTGGFKFVKCGLRTAGEYKLVKCRLSSTPPTPELTPASTAGDFKFVMCRLSSTGGSPTQESTSASTTGDFKFVMCRLSSTGELPKPESAPETTPASTTELE